MPTSSRRAPDHIGLRRGASLTELHQLFMLDSDFVRKSQLETKTEAVRRTSREMPDMLTIRFRRGDDREDLEDTLIHARILIPELKRLFEVGEVTLEFLDFWGRFQYCCARLDASHFSEVDD